ncbi:hypothetical protein LWI29_027407 [Acer saccharum]|uniref:Uncharacterized protein n=1 Tax=Acer saccharum TaxID=4024 RepID=A0AA39T0J4_ACESA|nr:hypothetical protein LWI29_027407 [Acer saccharum]
MLALGGFRRLHSLYLRQLSKRPRSGLNWAPPMIGSKSSTRCGRDKVHLSLPLLSPVDPNLVSPKEVTAMLSLAAACSSTGVIVLYANDLKFCKATMLILSLKIHRV